MGRFEQELRDALARRESEIVDLRAAALAVVESGVLCADGCCEHSDGTSPCDDLRRAVGR